MYNKDFLKRMALRAERDVSVVFYTHKNKTFCLSLRTGKVGISKCHKEDKYDHFIGIGLAYCRLKNIKVPESNLYERGTIIKYNDKEYYVINAYYDCPSLLGGFFLDVFQTDCNIIRAGQKMEKLHSIKKPEILKRENAEIVFLKSPSEKRLKGYIEDMKHHQEVDIEYLPYVNRIIMEDLSSNPKSAKTINYVIEDNYSLEENMAMAYCELKGIEPYDYIADVDIKKGLIYDNYEVLKTTDKYCYCLNTKTGRLETLKVVK